MCRYSHDNGKREEIPMGNLYGERKRVENCRWSALVKFTGANMYP